MTAGHDAAPCSGQAAAAGHDTAAFLITAQAQAGMSADAIEDHHHDVTARLLAGAATAEGQWFACSYERTAAMPIAELRDLRQPLAPLAATLPDGTRTPTRSWPPAAGKPAAACTSAARKLTSKQADVAFTDDFAGLTHVEQIARVQAVAREHGDQLTDTEAAQALNLYVTQIAEDLQGPRAALVRHQHELTDRHDEFCAGCLAHWPWLDVAARAEWQPEAGA